MTNSTRADLAQRMAEEAELDSADENASIYEYAARSVLMLYGDFVEGTPRSSLAIVSEHPLNTEAKKALRASADKLGYGREGCVWIVLRSDAKKGQGSEKLGETDLRTLLEGIDPVSVITTDASSLYTIGRAYDVQGKINDINRMNGRNVVALGDFTLMLQEDDSKQLAWRLMKSLQV